VFQDYESNLTKVTSWENELWWQPDAEVEKPDDIISFVLSRLSAKIPLEKYQWILKSNLNILLLLAEEVLSVIILRSSPAEESTEVDMNRFFDSKYGLS